MRPSFLDLRREEASRSEAELKHDLPQPLRAIAAYPILQQEVEEGKRRYAAIEAEAQRIKDHYEGQLARMKGEHEVVVARVKAEHDATLTLAEATQAQSAAAQDACLAVAEGGEGWEKVADVCPASQAAAVLRRKFEKADDEVMDLRIKCEQAEVELKALREKEPAQDGKATKRGKT